MSALGRASAVGFLILAMASRVWAAEISLGSPFGDHMVIQRDRPIRVWGTATPGADVEVRLGPRRTTVAAAPDGRWSTNLKAVPAGGPFVLSAESGGARAEVKDVLVGDVWLCSGQSNMQMTLKECDGGRARGCRRRGLFREASPVLGRSTGQRAPSDGR